MNIVSGQVVRLANWSGTLSAPEGGFQDDGEVLVDPVAISLKVRNPSGVVSVYGASALTKDGVGLYHLDVDTTDFPGDWTFAWSSTGPQTYAALSFSVDPAPL